MLWHDAVKRLYERGGGEGGFGALQRGSNRLLGTTHALETFLLFIGTLRGLLLSFFFFSSFGVVVRSW